MQKRNTRILLGKKKVQSILPNLQAGQRENATAIVTIPHQNHALCEIHQLSKLHSPNSSINKHTIQSQTCKNKRERADKKYNLESQGQGSSMKEEENKED